MVMDRYERGGSIDIWRRCDLFVSDQLAALTDGGRAALAALWVWTGCDGVCLLLKHDR